MERIRRCKTFIIATIACAVLLCAAGFSISLAAWTGGGNTSAEASGTVGQFYVEYPQYIGRTTTTAPANSNGTYSLRVTRQDAVAPYAYYNLTENNNASYGKEKMVTGVSLQKNDIISLYNGATSKKMTFNTTSNPGVNFDSGTGNIIVDTAGVYDFYYKYEATTEAMYVSKSANDLTTEYTVSFTIQFDGEDEPKTLHFKTNNNNYGTGKEITAWIWVDGGSRYYPLSTESSYPKKVSDAKNTIITVGSKEDTKVIFAFENSSNQWAYQSANLKLNDYAIGDSNYITLHAVSNGTPTLDAVTYSDELNGDEIVRNAVMNGVYDVKKGGYVYHNYICVKRTQNSDAESMAFVEFSIQDLEGGADFDDVAVKSVTLKRTQSNADGTLTGSPAGISPRLYVDAGDSGAGATKKIENLSDFNHRTESFTPDQQKEHNYVAEYYYEGAYCILFFAAGGEQYYALDIEIVTDEEYVDDTRPQAFKLVAEASNINHWQRYIQGYGQPYGFYLGGHINNVDSWNPRRTTKFSGTEITNAATQLNKTTFEDDGDGIVYEVEYPNSEINISLTVNLTKDSIVKAYLLGSNGYRWDGKTGDKPTKGRVAYLIPETVIMPDELRATFKDFGNGKQLFTADSNFNVMIPDSGDYTLHYVGSVRERKNTDSPNKVIEYMNIMGGTATSTELIKLLQDSGKGTFSINTKDAEKAFNEEVNKLGWYGIPNANLIVDKLIITSTKTMPSEKYTVTFEANGGTLTGDATQQLSFGEYATKPSDPTPAAGSNDSFMHWAQVIDGVVSDTAFDFSTPVTGDITLKAVWDTSIIVTLNAVGGSLSGSGTITVGADGKIAAADIPENPVLGGKVFDGWYTSPTVGEKIDLAQASFTENITLFAHYRNYQVTFNANGGSVTPASANVNNSNKLTSLPTPTRTNYAFTGWYNAASGGAQITLDNVYKADTTIYAQWTNNYYTISGDTNRYPFYANSKADSAYVVEYIADNVWIESGKTISFYVGGNLMSMYVDGASNGINISNTSSKLSSIATTITGKFTLYLHQWSDSKNWGVYATYSGLTYNSVTENSQDYGWLVGKFAKKNHSDFVWGSGYRMNKVGSDFVLEDVYLDVNDTVKIRCYNSMGSGIDYATGGNAVENTHMKYSNNNMVILKAGYYSFKIPYGVTSSSATKITLNYKETLSQS